MTTLQKAVLTFVFVVCAATALHQARRSGRAQRANQSLRQELEAVAQQAQEAVRVREETANRLTLAEQELRQLRRELADLPKIRAQNTHLREQIRQWTELRAADAQTARNPELETAIAAWALRADDLSQRIEQAPQMMIPEVQLCDGYDWLEAAKNASFQSEVDARKAFSRLRQLGKEKFGALMEGALERYIKAHDGQLPNDPAELKAYCDSPVDDVIFPRYRLLHTGKFSDLPAGTKWIMTEKAPVDREYDTRMTIGPGSMGFSASGIGQADENGAPVYADNES